MLPIIKNSKIWLSLSTLLVIASIALITIVGLNLSADFVPGTMMKLRFENPVDNASVEDHLNSEVNSYFETENAIRTEDNQFTLLGAPQVRTLSDGTTSIRTLRQNSETQNYVLEKLGEKFGNFETSEIRNISPTFAEVFRNRALIAIGIASLAIIAYVAYAFRKVPRHVNAWKFGVCAIVTLLHDIIITIGAFVLLGYFLGVEIDALFITALLTVLGYSVNDTIVVFDRIRENLKNMNRHQTFGDVAEIAVNQSITRSINTSLSTLITLIALFALGSDAIRWFVLALIIGAVVGTYSSIFLASPLLTIWQKKYR